MGDEELEDDMMKNYGGPSKLHDIIVSQTSFSVSRALQHEWAASPKSTGYSRLFMLEATVNAIDRGPDSPKQIIQLEGLLPNPSETV